LHGSKVKKSAILKLKKFAKNLLKDTRFFKEEDRASAKNVNQENTSVEEK